MMWLQSVDVVHGWCCWLMTSMFINVVVHCQVCCCCASISIMKRSGVDGLAASVMVLFSVVVLARWLQHGRCDVTPTTCAHCWLTEGWRVVVSRVMSLCSWSWLQHDVLMLEVMMNIANTTTCCGARCDVATMADGMTT